MHSTDASLEPVYDTLLSHQRGGFIAIGRTAAAENRERIFLAGLCNQLQLTADQHSTDAMKHAINNNLLNIVGDWYKYDCQEITAVITHRLQLLANAIKFLSTREGTNQINWAAVLDSQVRLLAAYHDIVVRKDR